MPTYDYQCNKCGFVVEIVHSIKKDTLKIINCPKCHGEQDCTRLICYNPCEVVFKGKDWTVKSSGFGARGYKGKFGNNIRPVGTTVDAPANKSEADKQFQGWVDSGGLYGVKPTFDINDRNDPRKPMTGEEAISKKKT